MNSNNTDDLFVQVRTAHRLLAAYYQRLLPTIERIAIDVGTEFYFWTPHRFSSAGQSNSNPFKKWQWDLLPAVVTRYVFKHVNDLAKTTKGDYIVEFLVINDSGVNDEKGNTQPNGLEIQVGVEDAKSVLQVGIYRVVNSSDKDFYKQWNALKYPNYNNSENCVLDEHFATIGFEVPISELMTEQGVTSVIDKIRNGLLLTESAQISVGEK